MDTAFFWYLRYYRMSNHLFYVDGIQLISFVSSIHNDTQNSFIQALRDFSDLCRIDDRRHVWICQQQNLICKF